MFFESRQGPVCLASKPRRPRRDTPDEPNRLVARDQAIYTLHRFHGWGPQKLASVHELSERHVKRILSELRSIEERATLEYAMG